MNAFLKSTLLFSGALLGAVVSTPILNLIFHFLFNKSNLDLTNETFQFTTTFYSSIIILLLTFMPVILIFTYFYVKGASEEQARTAARTTAKEEISNLKNELHARQSELAWDMAPFLFPVVRNQTEEYLHERAGEPSNSGANSQNPTIVAASTVEHWIEQLANNSEITEDEKQNLKEKIENIPPELKEE